MPIHAPTTKWCHLTWGTFRGHRRFKIAATAQFCERAIRDQCIRSGYRVDAVAVLPDRVHILIKVPVVSRKKEVLRKVKTAAIAALRTHAVIHRWEIRIWQWGGWCAVLTSSKAVWVIRKHIGIKSQLRYPGTIDPTSVTWLA
jgi:REP element-mobilizing transposase RayT